MNGFGEVLAPFRRVAFVCNQWGDTGKGKFVDLAIHYYLSVDRRGRVYCFRGTGGPNAGHSVVVDGETIILHEIPSGVLHDAEGCQSVIGRGVVLDPRITVVELDELAARGLVVRNLAISHEAPVITPHHIFLDRYGRKTREIGTTGRGVGPAYGDLVARSPIFVDDLLNPKRLWELLQSQTAELNVLLPNFDREAARRILADPYFGPVDYFDPACILNLQRVFDAYRALGERLRPFVTDVGEMVQEVRRTDATVVFEGAQGLLLSVLYGTTRFQTSSDSSVQGLLYGSGFKEDDVDRVFGIVKAPYMTRVGAGPFPTEMGGKESDLYCNGKTADGVLTKGIEREKFGPFRRTPSGYWEGNFPAGTDPEFCLGVCVRHAGNEFGATTGRPRRTGWLDLAALRYAVQINGPHLILTKPDVVTGLPEIKLGDGYQYRGPKTTLAGRELTPGSIVPEFVRFSHVLEHCEPSYLVRPGWNEDISGVQDYSNLPTNLMEIVSTIEARSGGRVAVVSTAADRDAVCVKR